jgi:hypothetical protein
MKRIRKVSEEKQEGTDEIYGNPNFRSYAVNLGLKSMGSHELS